jgi:hypothetical protein
MFKAYWNTSVRLAQRVNIIFVGHEAIQFGTNVLEQHTAYIFYTKTMVPNYQTTQRHI